MRRDIPVAVPLDLELTLGPLRRGLHDPTMRLSPARATRAWRSPEGPVTLHLALDRDLLVAEAWGPGAAWALDAVPALVGLDDAAADEYVPGHAGLARLRLRLRGLRIGRTAAVLDALVPAILEQRVTRAEAFGALHRLVRDHGERAPGPHGLWLLPSPSALASLPTWTYHRVGVEERRALAVRRAAECADALERAAAMPLPGAYARLRAIPGVGPWTAAEVGARALGDPDAVSVGDVHLPDLVAWALAGEPRGTDARMLELLAPYAGQRGRVIRWLEAAGLRAPRFAPRRAPRWIAAI